MRININIGPVPYSVQLHYSQKDIKEELQKAATKKWQEIIEQCQQD